MEIMEFFFSFILKMKYSEIQMLVRTTSFTPTISFQCFFISREKNSSEKAFKSFSLKVVLKEGVTVALFVPNHTQASLSF